MNLCGVRIGRLVIDLSVKLYLMSYEILTRLNLIPNKRSSGVNIWVTKLYICYILLITREYSLSSPKINLPVLILGINLVFICLRFDAQSIEGRRSVWVLELYFRLPMFLSTRCQFTIWLVYAVSALSCALWQQLDNYPVNIHLFRL